ncbi:Rossmann-like and DUF2520 domain-containing protein [Marinitoga arctica]
MKINIIGPGKVGKSLYNCFKEKNINTLLIDKTFDYSNFLLEGIVLITTQDKNIVPIWEMISHFDLSKVEGIGHCSGYLDSSFITGIPHFSMHPNFPFSSIKNCSEIKNITWGIEGDEKGIEIAKKLVSNLNGKYVIIPQNKKKAYHLAAVIASNFSYGLIKMARDIYEDMGIIDFTHLIDLSIHSLNNIKKSGLKNSLTGPVNRDDKLTIDEERKEFEKIFGNTYIYDFFIGILYKIKEEEE